MNSDVLNRKDIYKLIIGDIVMPYDVAFETYIKTAKSLTLTIICMDETARAHKKTHMLNDTWIDVLKILESKKVNINSFNHHFSEQLLITLYGPIEAFDVIEMKEKEDFLKTEKLKKVLLD